MKDAEAEKAREMKEITAALDAAVKRQGELVAKFTDLETKIRGANSADDFTKLLDALRGIVPDRKQT